MQLTLSTNKANMKSKELSKEVRNEVVENLHSGEGYKKILKSLIIPLSMVKSITNKWKMYHTTQTIPRSGRRSKLSSRASRKPVWDVIGHPTIHLQDLQGSISKTGISVHQSTISCHLHKADLDRQVVRKKPLSKKTHLKARTWSLGKSILMILQHVEKRFVSAETKI